VRRTLRTPITTRVVLLSATASVLVGTVLVVLIVAVTGQRDAARSAFRSQEALTAGNQLEKSLITIENGLRGFVAGGSRGRERFLHPATRALAAYPRDLERLKRLVADDPGQQRRVDQIAVAIDDYVRLWARPLVELGRTRPAAARSVVVTNGGRERLDQINREFASLFARERQVIRSREDRAEQRSARAIAFGFGGLGLVLVLTAAVTVYLRRAVVRPVVTVAERPGAWRRASCRRACRSSATTSWGTSRAASMRWPTRSSRAAPSSSAPTPSCCARTPSSTSSPR
jgi:CHASE3 domain sensor protein